jgi:hypothetical protein
VELTEQLRAVLISTDRRLVSSTNSAALAPNTSLSSCTCVKVASLSTGAAVTVTVR